MLAGCSHPPWFAHWPALVLKAESAAMKNNIVKAICPEELVKLWDFPTNGISRPFKNKLASRPHDHSREFKKAIYQVKGFLAHVLKMVSEIGS